MVEDAVNGVQAAKAGNIAALGLGRANDEEPLANGNADLVVTTLDAVSLNALAKKRLELGWACDDRATHPCASIHRLSSITFEG